MIRQLFAGFLLTLTASFGAAAVALPQVAPEKVATFKDWSVGCDNGLSCKTVSLAPLSETRASVSVALRRDAVATGGLSIGISGLVAPSDRYRIMVDRWVMNPEGIAAENGVIAIKGSDAIKLANVMAKGKSIRLVGSDGQDSGRASLFGVTAALRYIDRVQGRAGLRSAIIAKGRKRPTVRQANVPVISAKRIMPSEQLPDTAALVALSEGSPCAAERFGATEDAAYSLGPTQTLVLLNCGSGAYNFSVGAYIGKRDSAGVWVFAPASFDYTPNRLTYTGDLAVLVNAQWDSATQTVSSYSKGRGLGDCGSSQQYVWDGNMFRLIQASRMDECRGSLDWIGVWRAEVSYVS